ncbi:hypothetical protein [Streptomyces sp. NBC_00525]|uniref:hypothetical protein n=1 Tax=Streptomyces sp. NBC_00525 TaxID=2903660 RepID=UPI002E81951D|nr:hypothetical protein [Streptomyces sp. NBC_00525]WUC97403.1 hypothetical protein OG710_28980 [Streptomyces sp. NBC_00525]
MHDLDEICAAIAAFERRLQEDDLDHDMKARDRLRKYRRLLRELEAEQQDES